ncbi:MAG: thioredoxin [bacterium]|nr:thioredoxin [bacterium]
MRCLLLLGVMSSGLLASAATAGNDRGAECSGAPIVVKIHADWCSSCKALESLWTKLGREMGDRVTILKFDVSDRVAYTESEVEAKKHGLEDFFRQYRSQTGTIAILDCNSREPVAVMSGERDFDKYREAIAKASHAS